MGRMSRVDLEQARIADASGIIDSPSMCKKLARDHLIQAHIASEMWKAEYAYLAEKFPDIGDLRTAAQTSINLGDLNGARKIHLEIAQMYLLALKCQP